MATSFEEIQPPPSYVIFVNNGDYYAQNTITGTVSRNAAFHTLINGLTVTHGQSIYLKKNTSPVDFVAGDGRHFSLDYIVSATVNLPSGVSLISDGATLDARTCNDEVLFYNPTGESFLIPDPVCRIQGIGIVGDNDANSIGIYVDRWSSYLKIKDVGLYYLGVGITLNGDCINTLIDGANVDFCTKGIRLIKSSGTYYPNGTVITNSSFKTNTTIAIEVVSGDGIKILHNFLIDSDILISCNGGEEISNNYIQPSAGNIGIYSAGNIGLVADNNFYLDTNAVGIELNRDYSVFQEIIGNTVWVGTGAIFVKTTGANQSYATITGNIITLDGATSYGIYAKLYESTITGNKFLGGGTGIILNQSFNTITGNSFSNLLLAINLTVDSYYNIVTSNQFPSCTTSLTVGGDGYIIISNYFSGIVTIGGGSHFINRNKGYITENSGTATLADTTTSIAVTHGLNYTPSAGHISVHPIEPLNDASSFYVDTITATHFTINVNIDPGADVDFAWSVRRI